MFTPTTWYYISKELSDLWASLEDEITVLQTESLVKNYDKGTQEWYIQQLKNIPNFSKIVADISKSKFSKINKESRDALTKAIELVDNETYKAIKEMTGIKSIPTDRDKFLATSIQKFADFNKGQLNSVVQASVVKQNQLINNIKFESDNSEKTNIRVKEAFFDKTQGLYDIIRKQTEEGIAKGMPFTYSDGRKISFKAHMEMLIRTTIQNEAMERMEQATANLGIIFFLASEHSDCADDHAPYQGKIYVHEDWQDMIDDEELREKVSNFIQKNDIRTIQWVKGTPAYFATRPNCRHYFMPITIEQAMGDINDLKSRLRTKKGEYKKQNYEDLKQQRQNERSIRFYKSRLINNSILLKNTSDAKLQAELIKKIEIDKNLVKNWQKKQRQLLASNPNLRREYRREDANKMAQDLGVRFQLQDKKSITVKIFEHGKLVDKNVTYSEMLLKLNVKKKYEIAMSNEPKITKDIIEFTKKAGAYNDGLKFKLKSIDSLTRKIRDEYVKAKAKGIDLEIVDIANSIKDANRYTAILDIDKFVDQYNEIHNSLLKAGYKVMKTKNTFKLNNASYKGINSNYITPEGNIFELQFHTVESFALKNGILHDLYEQYRKIDTPDKRKKELEDEMIKLSSKLKIPKNIDKI